jgi:hypothetical protein
MSAPPERSASSPADPEVPLGQRMFDNMYFWLVAGIVVMTVIYTGWGLVEILTLPPATLP